MASTGQCLRRFGGQGGEVYDACLSPDDSTVVTACEYGRARLWATDTGRCLGILEGHTPEVFSAVFSPGAGEVL
eukprot:9855801-Alexandrium_andersonii.AAC.1